AETLPAALSYLGSMFNFSGGLANAAAQFTNLSFFITVIAVILCVPVFPFLKKKAGSTAVGTKIFMIAEAVLMVLLIVTSVIFLTGSDYNPFIYFRF
ncbi:MAG: hypothetical protein IKI93_12955, partial [Clostridia bacterium]|nr:hypothetical protein [Clostridia bacterium]